MDQLIFIDKKLFLFLNGLHNGYWDCFFQIFTSTITWMPLYIAIAWVFFKNQRIQGIVSIFFLAIVVLICDQLASSVCKPVFERLRPSHDEIMQYMVHLLGGRRGGSFGFISSHAANTFGIFTFIALTIRNKWLSVTLFVWALINCYSRIYVGLHYPLDLIAGALVGCFVGIIMYQVYLRSIMRFIVIPHHNKRTLKSGLAEMFGKTPAVVSLTFWVSISMIAICSKLIYHFTTL